MNFKILMQALKFACLPTISILTLLFFGFFSIDKTIEFIASDNGWAIALRVILVIAEIALVWIMYDYYLDIAIKEKLFDSPESKLKGQKVSWNESTYNLFQGDSSDAYIKYKTSKENYILIERKPKTTATY